MKYSINALAYAKGTSEPVRQALIAQAEEIERLKRCNQEFDNEINELNRLIAKQARDALKAIDNAKATASHVLKLAEEKEKALNPALLESERKANAILTNRVQELEQALQQIRVMVAATKHCSYLTNEGLTGISLIACKALEGKQ